MSNVKLNNSGFNRLKSVAVGGAIGLAMAGGAAFAVSSSFTITKTRARTKGASIVQFSSIGNTGDLFGIGEASIKAKNVSGMQQSFTATIGAKIPSKYRWHSKVPETFIIGHHSNVTQSNTALIAPSFSRQGTSKSTRVSHVSNPNHKVATSFPNSCGLATSKVQTHYDGSWTAFNKLQSTNPTLANCYYNTRQKDTGKFTHKNALNTSFTKTFGDAFDHVLWMKIDETNFVNPTSLVDYDSAASTATTAIKSDIVTGIDAQVEFYFPTGTGIVRALYKLSNTTGSDIDASVEIGGDLGSDNNTTIESTQNGDLTPDDSDKWHISSDKASLDPIITISRYGDGARVMPVQSSVLMAGGLDDFGNVYAVTVPANESISILVFAELNAFLVDANTGASAFESLSAADAAGLLEGLSKEQLKAIQNYDVDSDGDGVLDLFDFLPNDASETVDTDGDGVGDNADTDDDGDDVLDIDDAFPLDSTESVDTDSDKIGNNADTDDDGDDVLDVDDAFQLDATESVDTDGDGVGDNSDTFINDASESIDSDGDGVGDNADAFPNDATETLDTDSDTIGNNADTDNDGDDVLDDDDTFPLDATESIDTDSDGIGNNADTDDDGDDVLDGDDIFPLDSTESLDTDGDGVGDNADAFSNDATESIDSDGDGVGDNADAFPNDATRENVIVDSSSSGGTLDTTGLLLLLSAGIRGIVIRRRKRTK